MVTPMDFLPPRLVRLAQKLDLPVGALTAIRALKVQLEELEWAAIRSAREKGASLEDIAIALGVTRQALQQRVARHKARLEPQTITLAENGSPTAS